MKCEGVIDRLTDRVKKVSCESESFAEEYLLTRFVALLERGEGFICIAPEGETPYKFKYSKGEAENG